MEENQLTNNFLSILFTIENDKDIAPKILQLNIFNNPQLYNNLSHNIIIASIYRPLNIEDIIIIISQLNPPLDFKLSLLHSILLYIIKRSFKPRCGALGSMLYYGIKHNIFTISQISTFLYPDDFLSNPENINENKPINDSILFAIYPWIAPEIEISDPLLMIRADSIIEKESLNIDNQYPTVSRFLKDLPSYRQNDWMNLRLRRECSPQLKIYTSIFRHDNIEALEANHNHPAFNIDQQISTTIYETSYLLSQRPTLIQYATFCNSTRCISALKQWGADLEKLDSSGRQLDDFLAASSLCPPNSTNPISFEYRRISNFNDAISAAKSNNLDSISRLTFDDIMKRDIHKDSALSISADYGNYEVFSYILRQVQLHDISRINDTDEFGTTIIQVASREGFDSIVNLLLKCPEINVTAAQRFGMTPLLWACKNGHLSVVKLLLDSSSINDVDDEGFSALHWASKSGEGKIVAEILKHSPDLNSRQKDGLTPLHLASSRDVSKVLLSCDGIEIDAKDNEGMTPLIWVAQTGRSDVVKELIDHGADPYAVDNKKWTALHWAAQNGYFNVIRCFNECGKTEAINSVDDNKISPLLVAVGNEQTEAVIALIEAGADLEAKDEDGKTALHIAAREGNCEIIQILIQAGSNINAKQSALMTPLHYAVANNHINAVQILLQSPGIQLEPRDDEDDTPLDTAQLYGLNEISILLQSHISSTHSH